MLSLVEEHAFKVLFRTFVPILYLSDATRGISTFLYDLISNIYGLLGPILLAHFLHLEFSLLLGIAWNSTHGLVVIPS